jgi:predicted ABC-class ATPase
MLNKEILRKKLKPLYGKDYGAYQFLLGEYDFLSYKLSIHQIPKDPYAPPHTGIYCIRLNRNDQQVINFKITSKIQEIAFRDFLLTLSR